MKRQQCHELQMLKPATHDGCSIQMLAHRLNAGEYAAQRSLEKQQWNLSAALSMLTKGSLGTEALTLYVMDDLTSCHEMVMRSQDQPIHCIKEYQGCKSWNAQLLGSTTLQTQQSTYAIL